MSHDTPTTVSTGSLPGHDDVEAALDAAYERFRDLDDGVVVEDVPALADADPDLFGVALVDTAGAEHVRGDARHRFTIQSISKAFVYALVCQEIGHDAVLERVGVDNTGVPFDSVLAIEHDEGHPMNPMVNAGAIAATGLAPGGRARSGGTSWSAGCRGSPVATSRSTTRCTGRSRGRTSATRGSRCSSRGTGG